MRWIVLLVVGLSSSVHAAPDTPRAWADRLATHYAHAESLTIEESETLPPNRPCSEKRLYQLEPGYAALKVSSPDSNLFQDAAIRIARVKRGTDVVRAVRAEVKRAARQGELPCHGDKRYNAVLQAGDMLFIYGARCSEMYTPFVYDVADLAAAIEAEGGTLHALASFNPCGDPGYDFRTLVSIRKDARTRRKLYNHRFPSSREDYKQRKAAPAAP